MNGRPHSGHQEIEVREADLADPRQAEALVTIIDSYARGPGGQNAPLSDHARAVMADELRSYPMACVLFAFVATEAAGVAVCVESFSTFAGHPSLNIHDLAVLPEFQGRGVGTALLEAVAEHGRALGCCKITLEVHDTNSGAKRLYERAGFGPWDPLTLFVTRPL